MTHPKSKLYEKLSKKNPDGTIDNLSNTLNPAFYRGIHLEAARRLTPISQGSAGRLTPEQFREVHRVGSGVQI